jgi:D-glycero-alpha-D-manno-heptose-7-phosphate kinase
MKATITRLGCTRGMDLDISSEAPPGSGPGGSSALVSSVIGAVSQFENIRLDLYDVADLNYQIERKNLGIRGGVQDQYELPSAGLT